ncbi:hypothetical protein MTR_2g031400 [Medicago truncatula]|uniref:Uncharacterized protein n=1 Tax=Medicago truncatula TaxID=3880 RepID=G7IML8_MEDTR|nr:hypothetical protein MTR_2g031400 [Medicago truncatula]
MAIGPRPYGHLQKISAMGRVKPRPIGSGKGTKIVAHEGTGTGMRTFYKRGYGDGYYNTLPIEYPLPSLVEN